jgi:ribosomal protein S18 acetylase RimI-like enzyme
MDRRRLAAKFSWVRTKLPNGAQAKSLYGRGWHGAPIYGASQAETFCNWRFSLSGQTNSVSPTFFCLTKRLRCGINAVLVVSVPAPGFSIYISGGAARMFEEISPAPGFAGLSALVSGEDRVGPTTGVGAHPINLDPVRPSDEPSLYQTFASTRAEEMALTGWNAEQQETFLRMQYDAQRRSYLMQLPDAKYWVIRCDGSAAGRLIIDRTAKQIHVVDIALLPEFRKRGIGSTLMEAIIKEASQAAKTVRLHVERFNPALRWYERLGFSVVNSGPIYLEMVWRAAQPDVQEPDVQESGVGVAYADSSD